LMGNLGEIQVTGLGSMVAKKSMLWITQLFFTT
jgi:hypothetical protein